MSIDTAQLATDLGYVIADLSASATASAFISGTASVTVGELSTESTLVIAGSLDHKMLECFIPVASCSATPSTEDRIAITGQGESGPTNYSVVLVGRSPDGVAFRLVLRQDHRN